MTVTPADALETIDAASRVDSANNDLLLSVSEQQQPLAMPSNHAQQHYLDVLQMAAQDFPTKYAHFVARTSALLDTSRTVAARVARCCLLDDSMQFLSTIRASDIRSALSVSFPSELGIDVGGLQREWVELLRQELVEPSSGVFVCVNPSEQSYYLRGIASGSASVSSDTNNSGNLDNNTVADKSDNEQLMYCFATGRFVGRALLEGQTLGFHLALPLLKLMLGLPVAMSDLAFVDVEAYRNMVWILEHDGVDALGLTFSISERRRRSGDDDSGIGNGSNEGGADADGRGKDAEDLVEVDLIPDGRHVSVTDANKHEYLERKFRYLLFESVSRQLYVFLKGVYEVVPLELLMVFDPEELDYVLSGSDTMVDVDDWEKCTRYDGKFVHDTSTRVSSRHELQLPARHVTRVIEWFWAIVREMPDEYRRRLLHFATGSLRVPITGFSALTSTNGHLSPFTLYGVDPTASEYISTHACFNRLDIPLYASRAKLELVLYATLDTDLYGFTIA